MDPREARKQAMMARMQKSKQTSEGGGLGFFRGDLQNVQFWKCDEGDHELDIIPYFAGPRDPTCKEGEFTYLLEVFEHRDVGGIEGQSFICLMKTYGKPCPICQHRQQLIQEGADEELIKALRTSRYPRSIYNVVVYDSEKEQAKGVQVFHTSHYLMEQYLVKLAESSRREIEQGYPPYKFFADPEEGWSVKFTRTGQGMNTRYIAHQLVPRNYQIHQQILESAYRLDDLIYVPEYDEVYAAYWGTDAASGQSVAAPSVMPRGAASAPMTPAPTNAGYQAPAPAAYSAAPAPAMSDPYAQPGVDPVCPGGGVFGVNSYELEHCEQCEYWQPCAERNNAILAAYGGPGVLPPADNVTPAPAPAPTSPAPAAPAPAASAPAPQPAPAPRPVAPAPINTGNVAPPRQPVGAGAPAPAPAGPAGRGVPAGRGRGGGAPAMPPRPAAPGSPPPAGPGGARRIVR